MVKQVKGAAQSAPRTHNPHWKDNTRNQRQQRRRDALNTIALAAGFSSWPALETAAINGKAITIKGKSHA